MESKNFCQNPQEFAQFTQFEAQNQYQNIHRGSVFEAEIKFLEESSNVAPSDNIKHTSSNWSYSIRNCIFQGKTRQALLIYTQHRRIGSIIVGGAIPLALKACASLAMLSLGNALHAEAIKAGVEFDVMVGTALVDMYGKCGDIVSSRKVFDIMPERNIRTWNAMIGGCMRNGYFKKGEVEKAKVIFYQMKSRNLVNWNSLISGYAQNGLCKEALDAFKRMQLERFEPDEFTLVSALSACAQEGLLDAGKEIHEMIIQRKLPLNHFVLNGLVDMYAKCGDLRNANLIFEEMPRKNKASWNALILGFAIQGQCRKAIEYLDKMESTGEKPDNITFLAVLSACVHGGFVEEGLETFSKMGKYGLSANIKHYGCLVDLLGRAGKLEEAYNLIQGMPVEPNEKVLGALLGACLIHSDTYMAERVLKKIEDLNYIGNSSDPRHYVLLSSIYAVSEKWQKAEGMRVALTAQGSQKTPGYSAVILESTETGVILPSED
ncbi:hypothetical protein M9H77_36202 [Catharanthus roseus]|uniref:Uncharacterized protein n=1 Tax=Catharanthus roseus TaxID=4058 RepID=A0ACB9ZR51_CATRO|nr:hypothetical protein M9H77_36202 [Catharanthus roseus]